MLKNRRRALRQSGKKLRIRLGVTRPGNRIDLGHSGHEIVAGKPLEQGVAPLIQRQGVLFKDQLGHVTQQDGGIIEIAQASQPGLFVGGFGILDEIGDQRLGQFGGVILRCRFERMEQRRHGCRPARFLKGGDRGRLSRPCNPRQPLKARGRRGTSTWTEATGTRVDALRSIHAVSARNRAMTSCCRLAASKLPA